MLTAKRRRTTWAVAASVTAHLAVVIVVLLQHPTLPVPVQPSGPPEAIIPILIMPRTPPPVGGKLAQPSPIRLHRRPQRFIPPEVPTAPIAPPEPAPTAAAPPPPRAPVVVHPAPQPEGPRGEVRQALRQGAPGCANAATVGLNRAERELCDEKFGKVAKDATFTGLGLNADKQRAFDAAGARKELEKRYKDAPVQPGVAGGSSDDPSKPRDLPR
jgi:hypothetical protein